MALATLDIQLNAKLASLQQGLDKAGRIAERQAAQIERAFSGLKNVGAGVGAALAASLSVAGITTFVRSTVDGIDKLNDLSDATGASIENLSALEDIAVRTGTSIDTVGDAVVKLNKFLGDASKPGSDAANAIKALGLSAQELKKLDPAEAFRQVAVALAGFADDGNKARLVQELFGKSIREVAPLLKDVAEAGRLNATVTTAQAKAAEEFNKQIFDLQKNLNDAARAAASGLIPAINEFFARIKASREVFGSFGNAVVAGLGQKQFADAGEGVAFYTDKLKDLRESLQALETRGSGIFDRLNADSLKEQIKDAEKLEQFYRRVFALTASGNGQSDPRELARRGRGPATPPSLPDILPDVKPAKIKDFKDTTKSFEEAMKALEDTDEAKLESISKAIDQLLFIDTETPGRADVASALRNLVAARNELLTKKLPEVGQTQAQIDALGAIADTNAVKVKAMNKALDELFKMRETGLFGPEVDEAIENLRNSLASLDKPFAQVSEFAQQAARNIQDSLGESIVALFKGNSREIEDIWKNMLINLAAQAAAAQIGKYLLGDDFGKTGNVGGAIGELIKFFGSYGGARAMGGPVQKGRPYLVGERRPEIFVPDQNGRILPDAGAVAGGSGMVVNFNIAGDASENTVRLIDARLAQFRASMMTRGF